MLGIQKFSKYLKSLNFITLKLKVLKFSIISKTGVIKMLIEIPLTLETMQQLIIKPWRRSQGLCCRKKIQKHEKIANIFQNLLKYVILKS